MLLTVFEITKSSFQLDRKKIPLLVRTFRSDLSTGFGKDFEKLSQVVADGICVLGSVFGKMKVSQKVSKMLAPQMA
jgi:hypothetical protein